MKRIIKYINKLSNSKKITCLILVLGFVLLLAIGIPTLARYKNRVILPSVSVWDGSVASSYKSGNGTANDPYIISNGSELAYFYNELLTNNYENTYFTLSNDIVLNDGQFNYNTTDGITYLLNNETFYIDDYTNRYYDNVGLIGTEIGTINLFNPLNGFKGHLDGKSYRIYGLYMVNETSEELALFTNLQGTVENLYVENSIVYGGIVTAGIASTTNNASITSVLFNGYVVGRNNNLNKNINIIPTVSVINVENTETTNHIDLANNNPFIGSEIISTSLTGSYVINGSSDAETSIKINGVTVTGGSFNIDLGTSILDSIPVLTSTTTNGEVSLTFSNLSYNVTYNYTITGGIIGYSSNTNIKNTINKGNVYGYSVSGGLVGVTTDLLNINQSYNVGNISSEYVSGGLVGTIEKSDYNISLTKSYNTGAITASKIGGLIGVISDNPATITINNAFNTSSTNYCIGTITNTIVNVTNAYFTNGVDAVNEGTINGSFTSTTISNLEDKNYIINNLSFNEFVSFNDLETNVSNVWVYEEASLPIIFADDLNNPIASIHASTYTWNNLSYDLSPVKLTSNITFSIEDEDELRPIKEKYYYINNSSTPLTQTEIEQISSWTTYSGITQISVEGFYIIYVKVIDYNDNVTYLNTDLLILDLPGSSVKINLNDTSWTNLRTTLDKVHIDRPKNITIETTDTISGISSIKYYITNEILNTNDLNALNESVWTTYSTEISLNEVGTYIVYVKVTDDFNYVTYLNTDYIIFNGYSMNNLIIGRNAASYTSADAYITDKSTITLNTSYSNASLDYLSGYNHNLMSNILLPQGAKITLIDRITNKVYEYQIATSDDIYNYNNSCGSEEPDCIKMATIPLTLFKEIGTGTTDKLFTESDYFNNNIVSENFTIILDLSNTNITINYNDVALYFELHDSNGNNVRPTIYSSIKKFNVYSNVNSENTKANLSLTTDYTGDGIVLNSNSTTNINITSGLNYKYVNTFKIIDTTYEDKEIGLSLKLVDSEGRMVDQEYLKNMVFKIDEDTYYSGKDNIIRINLKGGIADVTKTLTITTYENNSNLKEGTYYLKITNYASYDGHYYSNLSSNELSIPVNVITSNPNIEYSFDVMMDDTNRIISKTSNEVNVSFDILQAGSLDDPNIKVSLYKKNELTAYNQNYSLVDLALYVSDTLNRYASNVYYVSTNPIIYDGTISTYNNFTLNLITANFESTGYKLGFSLYDGTKKIGTIEKYFIVK